MIRLIMTMTKGPTDPTAVVEFTDWNQVDDLAGHIAQLVREARAAR
jgi:menaquinone-dependent protoporphyrinogen oxidase